MQVKAPEVESQDGLKQPAHLKKKLTKKVQFLERVADSKKGALAARAGVKKKSHKQRRKKALPDLSSLADILAEVGQQPNQLSQQPQESKQHNKQKGRTEQITTSKARRVVTYVILCVILHHFHMHVLKKLQVQLMQQDWLYCLLHITTVGHTLVVSACKGGGLYQMHIGLHYTAADMYAHCLKSLSL